MNRVALLLATGGLLALAGPVAAAEPQKSARPGPSAKAGALSARIDEVLAASWKDQRITPAEPATDAEFLRRVYLDLAGRVPTVAEARAFLADTRPDRRARLVEHLLAGPRHVTHFTNVWRALLIPEANNNFIVRLQQESFE